MSVNEALRVLRTRWRITLLCLLLANFFVLELVDNERVGAFI